MTDLYPTFLPQPEILDRLNALDGPEVELGDLRVWAMTLKVRRPTYSSGRASVLNSVRTPERDAQFAALYPTMASDEDIIAAVNKLPAPTTSRYVHKEDRLLKRQYICTYAAVLNVWRSEEYRRQRLTMTAHVAYDIVRAPADEDLPELEIEYADAYAWGRQCGVRLLRDDPAGNMIEINKMRRKFHLPTWVARKRAHELQMA